MSYHNIKVALLVLVILVAASLSIAIASYDTDEPNAESDNAAALKAFSNVARVLRHQRCLNCHPSGNRPHVGEDRHVHDMNVQRGPENKGMAGLHCSACHRDDNQLLTGVPGAPNWHLAPSSMGWEGLDDHDLAAVLIDREKNGDRSHEDLIEHVEKDPLVGWGWKPGVGRSVPPVFT